MGSRQAIHAELTETRASHGKPPEKGVVGALIRHSTMLSTSVNPTDGLRFDGGAVASPKVKFIP